MAVGHRLAGSESRCCVVAVHLRMIDVGEEVERWYETVFGDAVGSFV